MFRVEFTQLDAFYKRNCVTGLGSSHKIWSAFWIIQSFFKVEIHKMEKYTLPWECLTDLDLDIF